MVDIGQVIEFYNSAAADLPDHNRLKGLQLPGMTTVLDAKGAKFAELFEPDNRRHWVPLARNPRVTCRRPSSPPRTSASSSTTASTSAA